LTKFRIVGGQEPEPLEPELRHIFYPEPRKNDAALREILRNFGKLLKKFRIHLTDRAGMLKLGPT
jgi:hypothetical protein